MAASLQLFRASLFWLADADGPADEAVRFFEDGLLAIEGGHVAAAGGYADLRPTFPDGAQVSALPGRLIAPGFVDGHVHYPQTDIIGAYGLQLLDWLERHAFPVEATFGDAAHARDMSKAFLDELLRHGTTTALVFATSHKTSAEAIFEAALDRGMRLIAGKVLMDRGAPASLLDDPVQGIAETEDLIARYARRGRLGYAVTPRFALTSSEAQLAAAGAVLGRHPDVRLHTHLAENPAEVDEAARLFPQARSYLDVYDRFGLVTGRSVFAHGIWLNDEDRARLAAAGSALCTCPTSNLFLGSGLFDLDAARAAGVRLALGTDVGGGTSFSMFATMAEAYKAAQIRGQSLDPLEAWRLATIGGAAALGLSDHIGNLEPGKEADFLVLDLAATPLIARRLAHAPTLKDKLFALAILGDDRLVEQTWIAGRLAHKR